MKKNFLFLFFIINIILFSPIFAGEKNTQRFDLSVNVSSVTSVSLSSASSIDLGAIVPAYNYVDTPYVNSQTNDPWQIANPIKVTLVVRNNTNSNLYVYTNHQSSLNSYWNSSVESRLNKTTTINGLINPTKINAYNWYMAAVPLRAWLDWNNAGIGAANKDSNWVWIVDKMGSPFFTQTQNPQSLLNSWQKLLDRSLDIYIRSCWNYPKVAGNYYARIFFQLDNQ